MLRKLKFAKPEDEYKDLGLGTKFSEQKQRIINRDGTFNVRRVGIPRHLSFSIYHELISMSWLKFNLLVVTSFIIANLFFASLYMLVGTNELSGLNVSQGISGFWDAFFFSGQTLTTVGFGRVSPIGFEASIIAAVESMMGLLGFALATGLLYGRFSKADTKIIYSRNALISPYKGINALMFRIINARKHQLIDVEIQVVFSRLEILDGHTTRHYYNLDLERKGVSFFPLSWTIVHPITEDSPLKDISLEDLEESQAEIMIIMKAFDDTFAQTVHSRSSYLYSEIVFNASFENAFVNIPGEKTKFDMHKFHAYKKVLK
ncbi:MAG: ion channel [Bacteroidota bacterium]|nr:ion channel [Bacteroidota bacterium]